MRNRVGPLILVAAALLIGLGAARSGAQESNDFALVSQWELSMPGLDVVGAQVQAIVVKTDDGYRRISADGQTVTDIDLPGITQVSDYHIIYCEQDRLAIYAGATLVYDGSSADLGVDSILGCFKQGNSLIMLSTTNGQNQITEHLTPGGVPNAGVVRNEIANPVSFESDEGGGLLVTDATGDTFHSPRSFWSPRRHSVGDFFVGSFAATRDGDVLTLYFTNGDVYEQWLVPEAAPEVLNGHGPLVFVDPTVAGQPMLTVGPPRLGDEQSLERAIRLPFLPDRTAVGGNSLYVEKGDNLTSITGSTVVLSQSHETYQAFSNEVVEIEMWGLSSFDWGRLTTGDVDVVGGGYEMEVERVPGGIRFVPPVMRPGLYDFRFAFGDPKFQLTIEGWHETTELRLSAPATPGDRPMHFSCQLEGFQDASEQFSAGGARAKDSTRDIPVGSVCSIEGEGWWQEIANGVTYDFLGRKFAVTVAEEPLHFRLVAPNPDAISIWVYVYRSGGAEESARQVEVLCEGGSEEIYQVPYDEPTRLLVKRQFGSPCYLVAFENENSDFVGIDEYLDYGEPNRLFREGIEINMMRPAWFDVGELIVHPLDDNPQFVTQQYEDFLGRTPTSTEIFQWSSVLNAGTKSKTDLVMSLLNSLVYQDIAGPNIRLYQAYFDRLPDTEGLQYWMNLRRRGFSLHLVSDQFALSQEFQNLYGDTSDSDFIRLVYENVLSRSPDDDGYAYWEGLLSSDQITRGELMVYFSESVEYAGIHDKTVQVVSAYIALLDSVPAPDELHAEVAKLADGGLRDVVKRIMNGSEYENRFSDYYRGPRVVDLTADLTDLSLSEPMGESSVPSGVTILRPEITKRAFNLFKGGP